MSEELKPCPFCGCPFAGISWPIVQSVRLSVKCPSCHSHGGYGNTEAEAAEAWNTRAPTDPMKELCEAAEPFVGFADACDARYAKRGGKMADFPDGHPAYDVSAYDIRLGAWRRLRTALENAKGGVQ